MPDRIEAGTLVAAAGIAGGKVHIANCPVSAMGVMLEKLREAGLDILADGDLLRVHRPGALQPLELTTSPYPGFPTDMQAQMMALMTCAQGTSVIRESVFENRFIHVAELERLGADIKVEHDVAIVTGGQGLHGASVMATDLRASASLVLAGLAAAGPTCVSRVYHLDRGYDRLDLKLAQLGADIVRQPESAQ